MGNWSCMLWWVNGLDSDISFETTKSWVVYFSLMILHSFCLGKYICGNIYAYVCIVCIILDNEEVWSIEFDTHNFSFQICYCSFKKN